MDYLTFTRGNCARARLTGLGGEGIHKIVVVRGIVMKQAQLFDFGFIC
jgi:hypothetical protein